MKLDLGELQNFVSDKNKNNRKTDIRPGDTVRVHYRIKEGGKERVQVFEGIVIAAKGGSSLQGSFTVRKIAAGVGVERTFPIHSPWILKIERTKSSAVRRAKLYFIRRYALSRRFKLKDKDVKGTVWEEIAKEHSEIEKSEKETEHKVEQSEETPVEQELDKEAEIAENTDNEQSDEVKTAGESGGESGEAAADQEEVSDSGPKS